MHQEQATKIMRVTESLSAWGAFFVFVFGCLQYNLTQFAVLSLMIHSAVLLRFKYGGDYHPSKIELKIHDSIGLIASFSSFFALLPLFYPTLSFGPVPLFMAVFCLWHIYFLFLVL